MNTYVIIDTLGVVVAYIKATSEKEALYTHSKSRRSVRDGDFFAIHEGGLKVFKKNINKLK